jgi:DNA-binding transcriptional MerR regulator
VNQSQLKQPLPAPAESETFSIGELADEFDVTPRTIRFYEEKGLISPKRNGQDRVYSRRDRVRLHLILRGKRLGFSLSDVAEMINSYNPAYGQVEQLRLTLEKSRERISALEQQRADIDEVLSELAESCQAISKFLADKGVS